MVGTDYYVLFSIVFCTLGTEAVAGRRQQCFRRARDPQIHILFVHWSLSQFYGRRLGCDWWSMQLMAGFLRFMPHFKRRKWINGNLLRILWEIIMHITQPRCSSWLQCDGGVCGFPSCTSHCWATFYVVYLFWFIRRLLFMQVQRTYLVYDRIIFVGWSK